MTGRDFRVVAAFVLYAAAVLMAVGLLAAVFVRLTGGGATATSSGPEPSPESVTSQAGEWDLPVTFEPGTTGVDLGLDVRHARLQSYDSGQSFVTVNAVLSNRGTTEIDRLRVRLELLNEAGEQVDSDAVEALDGASPILRPGDDSPFHLLRATVASVRAARLVAESVDQNPAPASYPPSQALDFEWRADRSLDLEIELRERSVRFSENHFPTDGSGYFDAVIEVENTGQRTLRALKLSAEIVGPGERWTVTEDNHVVLASGPSLRPGEVWIERVFEKVEERPEDYRLSVVAVR